MNKCAATRTLTHRHTHTHGCMLTRRHKTHTHAALHHSWLVRIRDIQHSLVNICLCSLARKRTLCECVFTSWLRCCELHFTVARWRFSMWKMRTTEMKIHIAERTKNRDSCHANQVRVSKNVLCTRVSVFMRVRACVCEESLVRLQGLETQQSHTPQLRQRRLALEKHDFSDRLDQ